MPEAGPPLNKFSLNSEENSVIVVTSIRPKGRPLSLRQQRLAEFCSFDPGRKPLKETSRREELVNSRADCDNVVGETCTSAAAVTMTVPFHNCLNQSLVYPLMEQNEDQRHDDVKVLYPARDLLYSDSDVAVLSSCSSWCVGPPGKKVASPSRMASEKFSSVDEIPPRPRGYVGLVDGSSGIGDRYHNKSPDGCVPSEDMVSISEEIEGKGIQKPYRQVWHSLWEHHVGRDSVRSSNSAKKSKLASQFVSGKVGIPEQITASVNNICLECFKERKQRRGVVPPAGPTTKMRVTYRSKTLTRSWGHPFYHRALKMGARVAQRKGSSMKDDGVEDSVSLFEKKPKPRRCELSDKKTLARAIATTTTRPGTAVMAAEKEHCESSSEPKSAPPNTKRGSENSNNRSWNPGKQTKSMARPRFSVPIKASRVPMDQLFKEMNAQKPEYLRRDADVNGRQQALKYRGMLNRTLNSLEQPLSDMNQGASSSRDARLAVHFNLPERSRSPSLQSRRRLYSPPLHNRADVSHYDIESDMNYCFPEAERKSVPNALVVSDTAPPHPGLKSNPTARFADRGARGQNSPNVPIQNHFYSHSMTPRQSVVKSPHVYNYNMEPNTSYRASAAGAAMSSLFNDIAVPPEFLYDGNAVSDQAPTAFRFSHPNAPDVLISPPPNPQLRGDTVCVPSAVLDSEVSPVPMYNPCVQTVNIPRYYGRGAPEVMIEENFIPVHPFFPQNVPFRPFMPSVDFSRFEPPPRPPPRGFPAGRENGQRQLDLEENPPFPANLQVGVPTPHSMVTQHGKIKSFKELRTFSAQVPSSSCIPPKSFSTRGSSSRLEMLETNMLCPRDTFKSNLIKNVLPEDPANVRKGGWLDFNILEPVQSLEPFTKQIRLGANIESGINRYPPRVERTILIEEKEDTLSILDGNVSSWKLSPQAKAADPETDFLQTSAFPLSEVVSGKNLRADLDFEARHFDLKDSRSVHRIHNSRTCSDTKLCTVREVSAEAQQSGSCPVTDVSVFDCNHASDPPTTNAVEVGPELVDSTNGDSVDLENCLTMNGYSFDTSGNEEVLANTEILANPEIEPYAEGHGWKSPVTGLYHRVSNLKPAETEKGTYPVASSDQQIADKEKDLIENTTILLDGILGDKRIATLLNSNSSQSRRRFQSLVARLDNIALHCKIPGTVVRPNEDNLLRSLRTQRSCQTPYSSQEQKVERRDAFVQVPVLCSQCVETEPFTAEKGVPDFRAGLTLRIMSTVVDVPPVIKRTESVGTNTDKHSDYDFPCHVEKDGSVHSSTMKHDGRLAISDQLCTTRAGNADSSFSGDRHQPVVPASVTNKQTKRLKPFFRSHRNELANVYNLAAVHSLTLHTEEARSVLSRDENLRTDSNANTEIRKEKHLSSSDDEWNYRCEHEQPGRAPKQHVTDRRVSFRPIRRETDIICPPGDACQDERPDQNRIRGGQLRVQNDDIGSQIAVTPAKDMQKFKQLQKVSETDDILEVEIKPSSKTADCIDVVDRSYGRSGGKKDKSSCRRKSGELFELSRPSCEDFNIDKVIALKRKPGCALCKKIPSSKKKGILKITCDAAGKHKPPDIPGSIVQFGLSSIVTPANVDPKEVIITTAPNSERISQTRSHQSRKAVKYIQSVASVIALEASKKSDSFKSDECTKCKDDRSMVIIHDSLATKNWDKDCTSDNADRRAPISYRVDTNRSTVPTICLTRAESDDVPDVESSPTSVYTTSMQIAFTAVESATEDIKDPENSNFVGRPLQDSTRSYVDAPSRQVEGTTSAEDCSRVEGTISPESLNSTWKNAGQTKVITFHNYSEGDPDFLRETSPSNAVQSVQRDTMETDSVQLSRGCMFTAMRRFMKNRSRPEPCAQRYNQCDNGYPGFQFTGVPVFESECIPLDTIRYCNRCKFKHVNVQDWSATLLEESRPTCESFRRRIPVRRTTSTSRLQKCTAKVRDVRDFTAVHGRDKDKEVARSQSRRDQKSGFDQNKTKRPSPCRKKHDVSKPSSSLNQDPFDSDGTKSGSSEILRIKNVSNDLCPYAVGGSCPESPQSSKHVLMCALCKKEDCVDKQAHAIRTLPFDVPSEEVVQMRYERCSSSLPRSSVSSRKSCARVSSAPAGQVRVSSGRCWPQAHSLYKVAHGPQRLVHKHVKLLDCDSFTSERCEHRKARQSIPSWICDDKPRSRKEGEVFLVFDDHLDDLDDGYAVKQCSCRATRKGSGV